MAKAKENVESFYANPMEQMLLPDFMLHSVAIKVTENGKTIPVPMSVIAAAALRSSSMVIAMSLILLMMFSSFLGLSCGKNAESSCHSCGYLTNSNEDFNYLGIGTYGAAVGLSHFVRSWWSSLFSAPYTPFWR